MKTSRNAPRIAVMALTLLCCWSCGRRSVIYPARKDIVETVYASGKIISGDEYQQFALSNGTIAKKLVKDGDSVKKGQLLYVIRNEAAAATLEAAEKNYGIAENNLSDQAPLLNDLLLSYENAVIQSRNDSITYQRWKNLWDKDIGSKSNLDNTHASYLLSMNRKKIAEQKYYSARNEIRQSYNNAKSQLQNARDNLEEYYISSNLDGIVYQTYKEAGEAVHSNEVVALIGRDKSTVIRLSVDQQDINVVKKGQQVLVQTDVTGDTVYKAVVTHIYPSMNEADQTFRVDARFTGGQDQYFIHSSIEANIILQRKDKALVVPRDVVDNDSVWIYDDGREKKIAIKTGITTLDYVEVLQGINDRTALLHMQKNGSR